MGQSSVCMGTHGWRKAGAAALRWWAHPLVAGLFPAIGFAGLGLAEADQVRGRIARLRRGDDAQRAGYPSLRDDAGRALAAIDEAAPTFRRYRWVKSLTSLISGVSTWLVSLAFGLPLAWVWGFVAFLLEYVPSVGSALAVLPPTLIALATGGPQQGLIVFLVVGALHVFLGNFVDPRLDGRFMSISPFGVLLSIIFWGWLWGPVGALLAVPLTVAFVIASRHIRGAHAIATLVAGDGADDDGEDEDEREHGTRARARRHG